METVTRVAVSFEPELLERLDALIRNKGYTNRLEAIRNLANKIKAIKGVKHGELVITCRKLK